jgi:hypothetical protein
VGFVLELPAIGFEGIQTALHRSGVVAVGAILGFKDVIAVVAILAMVIVIARHVLAVLQNNRFVESLLGNFVPECGEAFLHRIPRSRLHGLHLFFELLFRQLLVPNAVLLVPQVPASEAIMASLAVVAERAVRTIDALMEEGGEGTLLTVDTRVAPLALLHGKAVGAVLAVDSEIAGVETVLAVSGIDAHVAVAVICRVVRVSGILAAHVHDAWPRGDKAQIVELLEERPGEIVRPAGGELIPVIAPPGDLVIDDALLLFGINGDGLFPGPITLPSVEVPLVSVQQSPLLAAIGTERGWRKNILLAGKHR